MNTYVYDAANRLASFSVGSTTTTYAYNGLGDRYRQTVAGVQTNYVLDLNASLAQVLSSATSSLTTRYLLGLDVLGQQVGSQWSYFGYDGLGSVRQLTDTNGVVRYDTSFNPYGKAFEQGGTYTTSLGFTGEFSDADGLLFLRARYYAPGMGTFTSRDPFEGATGRSGSRNGYGYVEGNVPNRVDPSGMIGVQETKFILKYADTWLQEAQQINVPGITNMSDEALAVMIAAKFLVEDATCYNDEPTPVTACERDILSVIGRGPLGSVLSDGEISYGPANIPLRQAHSAADFWKFITGIDCYGLNFSDFRTHYYEVQDTASQPFFQTFFPDMLDDQIAFEMNGGYEDLSEGADWSSWLAVTMLQSAYRAQTYAQNNNTSGWGMPRSGPVSAYIIALGEVAYNENDQTLYDLSKWTGGGLAYNWVQAMRSIVDNLRGQISWLPSEVNWLEWTDQEKAVLDAKGP